MSEWLQALAYDVDGILADAPLTDFWNSMEKW